MPSQTTNSLPVDFATDPSQYDLDLVKAELVRITAILPVLDTYREREFRELPEKLQRDIRAVQTIVQPTSGGLEKVVRILWQLGNSKDICELLLRGESVKGYFERIMTPSDETVTTNTKSESTVQPSASPMTSATLSVAASQAPLPVKPMPRTTGGTLSVTEPELVSAAEVQGKPGKPRSGATLTLPE